MAIPQVLTALAIGLIGYQVIGKKKRKKSFAERLGDVLEEVIDL